MKRFPVGLCLNEREQKELTTLLGHFQSDLESEIAGLIPRGEGFQGRFAPAPKVAAGDQRQLLTARRKWKTAEKWVARFNPTKGKA